MKKQCIISAAVLCTVLGVTLPSCSKDNPQQDKETPDTTIKDYNGEKADDADKDIVGTDADIYWEANTFTNTVNVSFNGASATVSSTNDKILYHTEGAYVTIDMLTNSVKNVEIIASGKSEDGQLKIYGDKKFKLTLNGVELTSAKGPAINSQCKKRVFVHIADDTTNRLTDASDYADDPYYLNGATSADEDRKGCFFSEGNLIFSGRGVLVVEGKHKHGIATDGYLITRPGVTIAVTDAAKNSIQVKGEEDEGIGIRIMGGLIYANTSATAGKCLKTDSNVDIDGGKLLLYTTGGSEYDSDENDTSSAACIKADGNISITGGEHTLKSTGIGGKGINIDGDLIMEDGTITVSTTGGKYIYDKSRDLTASPKGIKADGNITIDGGKISISVTGASDGSEGLESKSALTINGGEIYANAYDDAINAASDITINGGFVYAHGTHNDGIDANGNCYINGGVIYAIGAAAPEVAIDANTEEQKKLYISGGTLVAIGGLESGSSLSQACYASSSWSKDTWYALYNGEDAIFAFKTPSTGGSTLVVSTSGDTSLKSGIKVSGGTQYFDGAGVIGGTVTGGSSVSLSTYTSNGGNRPGGPGRPGEGGNPGGPGRI